MDDSTKDSNKTVEDNVWNEDPQQRYRQTMFAPGAGVNINKAITPKVGMTTTLPTNTAASNTNANSNASNGTSPPKKAPQSTKASSKNKFKVFTYI